MKQNNDGTISFSPTDVSIFSACRHASLLDVLRAESRPRAKPERTPDADVLFDALLRAGVFLDLSKVTRQGARVGVESYSLKDLEQVHGYHRDADLRTVGPHKRAVEHGLMLGEAEAVFDESYEVVRVYNRDDVVSTIALRDWLEEQRQQLVETGAEIPRPPLSEGAPGDQLEAERTAAMEVIESLEAALPEDEESWNEEQRARALLANLIDFERREENVKFWEKFELQGMEPESLPPASNSLET